LNVQSRLFIRERVLSFADWPRAKYSSTPTKTLRHSQGSFHSVKPATSELVSMEPCKLSPDLAESPGKMVPGSDIRDAITVGLASLGTHLDTLPGKSYYDEQPADGITWSDLYHSRFQLVGLQPLRIYGEYQWKGRYWIIFGSSLYGLLQYRCDDETVSVLSSTGDGEEIVMNLIARTDCYLGSDRLVSEDDALLKSDAYIDAQSDGCEYECPNFGRRNKHD
jgi:hypothetical protein